LPHDGVSNRLFGFRSCLTTVVAPCVDNNSGDQLDVQFEEVRLPGFLAGAAVLFYADSGWSFGLPGVRASIGNVISPERKTLLAPSFGVGVTVWKYLQPFADFTVFDTGWATASLGATSVLAEGDTWAFNGGLRVIGGKSRVRLYGQFGGGVLSQNLKATFTTGSQSSTSSVSGSAGTLMYGGGLQLFAGRKWGSDVGFYGFHIAQPINGGSQNFSQIRIGLFYQTKSVRK